MFEQAEPLAVPMLLLIGTIIIVGYYFGNNMKYFHFPSIIGFMLFGVILGPSLLNVMHVSMQEDISFITEIALGFVALSIGLELNFETLKRLGVGIVYIILLESFGAFVLVFLGLYALTGDLPLSLIFASVAPASAPAGTVAVIHEYKARGSLTKALYAVVGFDDGLGIIIFGFAMAISRVVLLREAGETTGNAWISILGALREIGLSLALGVFFAFILSFLARHVPRREDVLILTVGFILAASGLSIHLHLSLILTNMTMGLVIVNTQQPSLVRNIHERLPIFMPILFILFFTLAGANLHIQTLPSLGMLGLVYVLTRSAGLILGARLGAIAGKVEKKIKNYLGLGILSQAGVAIGLALIVKHDFEGLGRVITTATGQTMTTGDRIGLIVITSVTATCIFFEIIGPILTKIALKKAGEIPEDS